jgi:hypothetical protein
MRLRLVVIGNTTNSNRLRWLSIFITTTAIGGYQNFIIAPYNRFLKMSLLGLWCFGPSLNLFLWPILDGFET